MHNGSATAVFRAQAIVSQDVQVPLHQSALNVKLPLSCPVLTLSCRSGLAPAPRSSSTTLW